MERIGSDMKLKIGVLSDTHLYRVTGDLRNIYDQYLSDMDIILHAGDFVSEEVVKFFSRKKFHGVHGNMDPFVVKAMLPEKKVMELGPYRLGIIHGWGSPEGLEERIRPEFQNMDVIVYGHSHMAVNHVREGILYFNPGTSIGFPPSNIQTIGILELDATIKGKIMKIQ